MIRIFNNISLLTRNSFHIDVTARELIEYDSVEDLREIFTTIKREKREWMVLSGGNNILFTGDVEQTLLTPCNRAIEVVNEDRDHTTIRIEAGAEWDDVVQWCVDRDLWGIENLSLIPGKAGAAPIQNIGAYGMDMNKCIVRVEYFDTRDGSVKYIARKECKFDYRYSIFKGEWRGVMIVTAIEIRVNKFPTPRLQYADLAERVAQKGGATLKNIRDVIIEIRRSKLPDPEVLGNAGSFFKNPIVISTLSDELLHTYTRMPVYPVDPPYVKLAAGWLIDNAGMKGYREGNVGVHSSQALVLVNHGGATGQEVIDLALTVQECVYDKFGVTIEAEVNIL